MKRSLFGLGALLVVACGGGQTRGSAFDPDWRNDNGAAAAQFQQQFAATKVPLGADVAVGVVGKDTLIGAPLGGGTAWTAKHAMESRPTIAGGVVVGLGGGELFAIDAHDGKTLWTRPALGTLRGAGDDGKTTIVSFLTPSKTSTILAVDRSGSVVRQLEAEVPVGAPAVVGNVAFLPWQGQYVTIYDLRSGDEAARVLLRSATSRAFLAGGAVFFGEIAATRFDDKIGGASSDHATTMTLPSRELPGTPRWMTSGVEGEPIEGGAYDRVRLYARPRATGPAGASDDRFAATYYRVALGFDAQQGNLAWVHTHDSDFIGGAAYAGGFALCDENGKVTFIEAKTGAPAGSIDLGKKLTACLVQADGLSRSATAAAPPLSKQIADAVSSPHAELVTIQKFLLREMASLQDDGVTATLIAIASNPLAAPDMVTDARKQLSARRTGKQAMLDALKKHVDFLADVTRPPPVGPLADALAAMNAKEAAPLLAEQLGQPAISEDDVMRAAAALATLATKDELQPIATFFAEYRGLEGQDAGEPIQNAVVSCAQALMKIGGADLVLAAVKDPFTNPIIRDRIAALKK